MEVSTIPECSGIVAAATIFSGKQYVAADSAYACTPTCMPTYKTLTRQVTPQEREVFNTYHSKNRIKVEHCIGGVKFQFGALRELNISIRSEDDVKKAAESIKVGCILYNFGRHKDKFERANRRLWVKSMRTSESDSEDDENVDDVDEDDVANLTGENKRRWILSLIQR